MLVEERLTPEEHRRLMSKISYVGECWVWSGTVTNGGVPVFKLRGESIAARTLLRRLFSTEGGRPHRCSNSDCSHPCRE